MRIIKHNLLSLIFAAPLAAFAAGDANPPYSPYADVDYPTDVYFGDTHVHPALDRVRPGEVQTGSAGGGAAENPGAGLHLADLV